MKNSREQDVLREKRSGLPRMLLLAASIYLVWLTWLGYVAWVNVSAGNQ